MLGDFQINKVVFGIYTHSQKDAKVLALIMGNSEARIRDGIGNGPEFHGDGYYGHYHGGIAGHGDGAHIWYGGKLTWW